jgi:cytochrome c551/c552
MKIFTVIAVLSLGAILTAQQPSRPTPQSDAATLDKMNAAGKSQREIAQYVFDTHGCNSCHTAGKDGKLGFTSRGQAVGKDFEGCVRLLTAMNLAAQVADDQRNPDQKKKAARFQEFGCTYCHQITPGKMGLTPVGAKLSGMHLGCVQVEQHVAGKQ